MAIVDNLVSTRRMGYDGFNWFVGQIEESSLDNPENKFGYRYKVRIVGDHPQSKEELTTNDLPWANTMMPVTTPYVTGNRGGATPMLDNGGWVIGFYMDGTEGQKPMIVGSIGQLPQSTTVVNYLRNSDTGFITTIPNQKINTPLDGIPPIENTTGGSGKPTNNSTGQLPVQSIGDYSTKEREATIPPIDRVEQALKDTGLYSEEWCQETPNRCGPKNVKETFTGIFEELFYILGQRAGTILSNSGINVIDNTLGSIKNVKNIIRKYVNKTAYVIDLFVAKVKGAVKEAITDAINALIKAIIRPTPEGNILTPITRYFNKLLAQVDCIMEDLGERLAEWLANVLFRWADEIYRQTACQVDRFVQGVLREIYNLADLLLFQILEPIENLLLIIDNPLNILRIVDERILKILGITCSSPKLKCEIYSSVCTNGSRSKDEEDILDRIIDSIENNFPGERDDVKYICDDAKDGNSNQSTSVNVIGGLPVPIEVKTMIFGVPNNIEVEEGDPANLIIRRTGFTEVAASLSYRNYPTSTSTPSVDYEVIEGEVTFASGETEKPISFETYFNFNNINTRDVFFEIAINIPINADNLVLEYEDGRRISRISIVPQPLRLGGNFEPNTDVNSEIENENNPDLNPGNDGFIAQDANPDLDTAPNDDNPNMELENDFNDLQVEDDVFEVSGTSPSSDGQIKITTSKNEYTSGDVIFYQIESQNIPIGREYNYTLFSSGGRIIDGATRGTLQIEGNNTTIPVSLLEFDNSVNQRLDFTLDNAGLSFSVQVIYTKLPVNNNIPRENEPERFPIIDETNIITDSNGGIIDIPIKDSGNINYAELPFVTISGSGYGARALPVLNKVGKLAEIRVIDPGVGYLINSGDMNSLKCIIDDFTLIRPGFGYKDAIIYVNGESNVAEAIIENEYIMGARLLRRDVFYQSTPNIEIFSTTGFSAKIIPSMVCVTDEQFKNRLSTENRIRKGVYIDCP